jgi:hypothetical protein
VVSSLCDRQTILSHNSFVVAAASKKMIMTRLILVVSLILLWTKEVKAAPLHYSFRYRESTDHQSKVVGAGGKQKGFSGTQQRRSLQGVSCGTLTVPLRNANHS